MERPHRHKTPESNRRPVFVAIPGGLNEDPIIMRAINGTIFMQNYFYYKTLAERTENADKPFIMRPFGCLTRVSFSGSNGHLTTATWTAQDAHQRNDAMQ